MSRRSRTLFGRRGRRARRDARRARRRDGLEQRPTARATCSSGSSTRARRSTGTTATRSRSCSSSTRRSLRDEPLLGRQVRRREDAAGGRERSRRIPPTTGRSTTRFVGDATQVRDAGPASRSTGRRAGRTRAPARTWRRRTPRTCRQLREGRGRCTSRTVQVLPGLERAEQPGVPQAAVQAVGQDVGHPERASTTRRSATRSCSACTRAHTGAKVACGVTAPAREQRRRRASRPSVAPLPFLTGDEALRREGLRRVRAPSVPAEADARRRRRSRAPSAVTMANINDSDRRQLTQPLRQRSRCGSRSTATRPTRRTRCWASRTRSRRRT